MKNVPDSGVGILVSIQLADLELTSIVLSGGELIKHADCLGAGDNKALKIDHD